MSVRVALPFVVLGPTALVACSATDPAESVVGPCDASACPTDAAPLEAAVVVADAALSPVRDATPNPWDLLGDAGFGPGPLTLVLSATGAEGRVCGDCAVVSANVTGGQTPYDYVWNDPALTGPGPHELCDAESRSYSVTVSDASRAGPDDPTSVPMTQTASTALACRPAQPDAGTALSGCKLLLDASILSILNPNGPYVERVYACEAFDGSPGISSETLSALADAGGDPPVFAGQGFEVREGMKAGESYELTFELLLPITLGGMVRMELWGSGAGCGLDEALGTV
ncbi:MAG TPA: hypothetical protein VFZ61_21950, partial [Polyangiales bacterium]